MSEVITTIKVAAGVPSFLGAAVGDLVSLADVKLELQLTDGANDVWLAQLIARASHAVAQFCNRMFQVQTYQDQFWATRDPSPRVVTGGFRPLQLTNWPIVASFSPAGAPPPAAPSLTAVPGGALPARIYYARITYVTAAGETAASLESLLAVPANQLVQIAAPVLDAPGLATGWNAYISTASFTETLQNLTPLAIGVAFTLPSSGLITAAPMPPYVTAVENAGGPVSPVNMPSWGRPIAAPLAEGIDFDVDQVNGQLTRLSADGYTRSWPALPLIVQYQAGFTAIPQDLQEALIRLVKMRWFARDRDPMIRAENVQGIYDAQYFFGTGPGSPADMPADIASMLARNYRVPVIA